MQRRAKANEKEEFIMRENLYAIPEELQHSEFFNNETKIHIDKNTIDILQPYFSNEILYFHNEPLACLPWERKDEFVKEVMTRWNTVKEEICHLHHIRSREIHPVMIQGIALYFMLLFWGNNQPVKLMGWKESLKDFHAKAVNVEERLEFILLNPKLYHSYVQLAELMTEQYKQYCKLEALKNRMKKKE